jgi:xanthine/uracil permease
MKMSYLIIFLGLVCIDVVYVFYLKYITSNDVNKACSWASIITFLNGIIIINYNYDFYSVASAMIGAYVGTYISMKFFSKKDNESDE